MKIFPDKFILCANLTENKGGIFPSLKGIFPQEKKKDKGVKTWMCKCVKMNWTS